MTISPASPDRSERVARLSILWLQRIAGLALFVFGVLYWVRLVGIYPQPGWRFDLMTLEWRVAAPLLAVLCPVAGVGLWLAVSWGVVLWVLVAAIEAAMHLALPRLFGAWTPELIVHALGLFLLTVLRLTDWQLRRRRAKKNRKSR